MKKIAIGLVLASTAFFGLILGMAYGLTNKYAVMDVLEMTHGIWIPGLLLALSFAPVCYFTWRENGERAEKFKAWCIAGLTFGNGEVKTLYLDALVVALDTQVITHYDATLIIESAAATTDSRQNMRAEVARLIHLRLESHRWLLKTADANRRSIIEAFGYYIKPNESKAAWRPSST